MNKETIDILKMYDLVFQDIVKCYLEDFNCEYEEDEEDEEYEEYEEEKEKINLTDSEIKEIAHKLIYKSEYMWETINEHISNYIKKYI